MKKDKRFQSGFALVLVLGIAAVIIAKKIGKVYRIPVTSISFAFTGLDYDLYEAEQEDLKSLPQVQKEIAKARSQL